MSAYLKILIFLLILTEPVWSQNELLFFQTNWGFSGSWEVFFSKTKASGYDGVEIWFPKEKEQLQEVTQGLQKHELKVIYLCGTNRDLPFEESLSAYQNDLIRAIDQKPYAINSHTGSDFFSFEQNKKFILLANELSKKYKIPIYHETHRGRFSYSLPETKRFLDTDSNFRLTLDISHWMVVHESLLHKQAQLLDEVIQRTDHIHARVGFEEGPQVNHPQAPEWTKALERHLAIWESIISSHWKAGRPLSITTEFGPPHYLPTLPFTQMPVSDQWESNYFIMETIKKRIKIKIL